MFLAVLACGCEVNNEQKPHTKLIPKYQIVKDDEGNVYRLNSETGDMVKVVSDMLKPIKSPEQQNREKNKKDMLLQPIDFSPITIGDGLINVDLQTIWKEGNIYYIFNVSPYKVFNKMTEIYSTKYNYKNKWFGFTIIFLDENGFELGKKDVNLWSMTNVVDEEGNYVNKQEKGNFSMTQQAYESILSYSVGWNLDKEALRWKEPNKLDLKKVFIESFKIGRKGVYKSDGYIKGVLKNGSNKTINKISFKVLYYAKGDYFLKSSNEHNINGEIKINPNSAFKFNVDLGYLKDDVEKINIEVLDVEFDR